MREKLVSKRGYFQKVMYHLKKMIDESANNPEIKEIAKRLATEPNPVQAVFDYAYENVVYIPDREAFQQLRYAWETLRSGKGNCTDYSILISALLKDMGIDHQLRTVKNDPLGGRAKDHIYVITKKGTILDPVIGHRQDGTDTRGNRPAKGTYNTELPYLVKRDFKINMYPKLSTLGRTKKVINYNRAISLPEGTATQANKQIQVPQQKWECETHPYRNTMCYDNPFPRINQGRVGCDCGEVYINNGSRRNRNKLVEAIRQGKTVYFQGHNMGNPRAIIQRMGNSDNWTEDGFDWSVFDQASGQGAESATDNNIDWNNVLNTGTQILNNVMEIMQNCSASCNIAHPINSTERSKCKCRCSATNGIPTTVNCSQYGITAPGQPSATSPLMMPALAIGALLLANA